MPSAQRGRHAQYDAGFGAADKIFADLFAEKRTQLVARDAEVAQLRVELAARDIQIQELKDGQREMEGQLDEALDTYADVAHAITAGANIMMAEQFTQTQQEFADLRQYVDRIRAEHVVFEFVLEAQWEDTATVASSQEPERVLSDLSDETYMTANSTYDASDEPEPE